MEARTSAAARGAPRRVRPATPAPANRAAARCAPAWRRRIRTTP